MYIFELIGYLPLVALVIILVIKLGLDNRRYKKLKAKYHNNINSNAIESYKARHDSAAVAYKSKLDLMQNILGGNIKPLLQKEPANTSLVLLYHDLLNLERDIYQRYITYKDKSNDKTY